MAVCCFNEFFQILPSHCALGLKGLWTGRRHETVEFLGGPNPRTPSAAVWEMGHVPGCLDCFDSWLP